VSAAIGEEVVCVDREEQEERGEHASAADG
jgi:hypothetical protein